MPRPSKPVSPDTLGGRIRAAREHLHLSLAEVADGHYSTSLISQIERNRVDPSQESLRFLAERLELSLEDLESLAQQHRGVERNSETEAHQSKSYESLRTEASQWLAHKNICKALGLLQDLHFSQVPAQQRWRLAALRGQAYFEQRKFLKAQQDFIYAVNEHPALEDVPMEHRGEYMLLHLHLAGTCRELQQLDDALEHYKITLRMMNSETPSGYVAEAHWGIALIAFAQAHGMRNSPAQAHDKEQKLRLALEHAENARFLYRSVGEQLRAAAVTCQIAQIEQTLGEVEKVGAYLKEILRTWSPSLEQDLATTLPEKRKQQEEANVVAIAACSLANIELEAKRYAQARSYVDLALAASKRSYKLRRADAYLMLGRILEAINPKDPAVEEAFRHATTELADTDRIAARISAHVRLGRHLLKIGKPEESEQELEQAHLLSELVSVSNHASTLEDNAQL
ncbi:XRE family transcriptional regulator [Ktedonosporobacter rubrisoli]|uniref:XRE family transcriptional regulator n=1 Tax=Ktedonosporobacter rubrisoli TaxID=2509675 RepID=A0A4P6K4H1_KTERU|nr:helix-turn-helix transcriptional regulator [Ktedonosporobacter rubrisoli]QBD82730.1 XRE family transcriptional regulator [Ktedonosporobacter rubrisoli]